MVIPTHVRRSTDGSPSSDINWSPVKAWLTSSEGWNDATRSTEPQTIIPVLTHLSNNQDEAVSSNHIIDTAKLFKTLADMSRDPTIRQKLTTQTELAQISCLFLERLQRDLTNRDGEHAEQVFLLVQVLRCICNLSADNDEARMEILNHGGVESLAKVLRTVREVWRQPLPVGQAAFGAVLNVTLDNEPCTTAMIAAGALQSHLKLLAPESVISSDSYLIWSLISMSLDNMCENKNAVVEFEQNANFAQSILRSLARLSRLISNNEENSNECRAMKGAQRTLLWVLCEALEKSSVVPKQLCQPESLLAFFDILEFYLINGNSVSQESDDMQEGSNDDGQEESGPSALPPNKPMPQATNRYADAVTQVIVAISGDDDALTVLFDSQSLMIRLLSILSADRGTAQDTRTQRLDGMAAAAALCLGNLARTDDHCVRLVSEHPALIQTLIHEWFAPRSTNVRTRHAASGLLKNLSMPVGNKQLLMDFGLVPVAYANIDTMVVPIQANSISILRHLLNGPPAAEIVLGMFHPMVNCRGESSVAMRDLLDVVKQTDIDAIRCEGTRLIAAVAKKIYLNRDGSGDKSRGVLDQARDLLVTDGYDVVRPLVTLVINDGQRHPLLLQECLVALTVLAATHADKDKHVGRIVGMLSPANSLPLNISSSGSNEAEDDGEDGDGDESDGAGDADVQQTEPVSFSGVLKTVIRQEGNVWPQAALQAKSLLKSLGDQIKNDPDNTRGFDPVGLQVFQNELMPFL
ncbi:hypothetical protein J3B02_001736 [Coemansia erecta]|nr:hypothetical protein J3B02_001736 [Coemansia erecta]